MSPARRLLTLLAAALVLTGLTGCFRSDKPLIGKAEAAFPFEELTVTTEDGETSILRRDGDRYLYSEPSKPEEKGDGGSPSILLHQVAEGQFILQETAPDGRSIYLFAKREENRITVSSVCRGLDDATLDGLGIERERSGGNLDDCIFKDLKSLTGLAPMPALWANETKTLEIVSIK